eukprot:TRINITY_DN4756_c0_g2_i3.p3 TRINITY_DN4756_c0_g2~~TRINITY_DN4756_c0_g2_i3.p3  ORF type:complete len:166 (+),score=0.77 TRINITY_DN4756_c0_g2_i3:503-1000(+)
MVRLSSTLRLQRVVPYCKPYNPGAAETTLVWAVPRSLATTQGITIVFSSSGYLDVSVPRVRLLERIPPKGGGLPHSEIHGSQLFCSSPQLIAALHVLHRLYMPRHPPCALNCFYQLYLLLVPYFHLQYFLSKLLLFKTNNLHAINISQLLTLQRLPTRLRLSREV